jgi:hypothetical protein
MSSIQGLASLLGLSFVSGINLYAAVLVVGLGERFAWFHDLPPSLHGLAHPAVIVAAGVMYLLEFFADKIPFVTPIWDAIHTFIRPLGAALLAMHSVSNLSPAMQAVAALAGGSIALGTHSSKMGFRLLAHATPEPVTHSAISVAEDIGVVGLLALVYTHPWVALGVLAALLVLMAMLAPLLLRTARFLVAGIAGRLRSRLGSAAPPCAAIECYARRLKGVPRLKRGLLAQAPAGRTFSFRTLFGEKRVEAPGELSLVRGVVFDVLAGDRASFYVTKDWSKRFRAEAVSTPSGRGRSR